MFHHFKHTDGKDYKKNYQHTTKARPKHHHHLSRTSKSNHHTFSLYISLYQPKLHSILIKLFLSHFRLHRLVTAALQKLRHVGLQSQLADEQSDRSRDRPDAPRLRPLRQDLQSRYFSQSTQEARMRSRPGRDLSDLRT